jgi:molybdopterin-guanine dinucleotide biosynthesis protein A
MAAVVLAGGGAKRMGGAAKPVRRVGGVALLARVLAATAAASPRVVVGPLELVPLLPRGVSLTQEDPPGSGPVAATAAGVGLVSGAIRDASDAVIAILAADLPFITTSTVDRLSAAATADGYDAAVLVDDTGRPQWLCGVWRAAAITTRLADLGEPAGHGMRDLVEGLHVARLEPGTDQPPPWFDCDTEDDLRRAEELIRGDAG